MIVTIMTGYEKFETEQALKFCLYFTIYCTKLVFLKFNLFKS